MTVLVIRLVLEGCVRLRAAHVRQGMHTLVLPQSSPLPTEHRWPAAFTSRSLSNLAPVSAWICHPSFKCLCKYVLRNEQHLKNHLPEGRGILYHFPTALAFLGTHLRSRVGVHLSEKEVTRVSLALVTFEPLWVNKKFASVFNSRNLNWV